MTQTARPTLQVEERLERGSRATRRLRRAGLVPGVVYGAGNEPVSFKVTNRDLRAILVGHATVIDLRVGDGQPLPVIVKDQALHPVRGEVIHIDLLQVNLDEKIHSTVPVELQGGDEAPGVKEGGVLEHGTRELNVEALPTDLPEYIAVDVRGMEAAATMHLSELTPPPGVTFLDDPEDTIIASVTMPSDVVEDEDVEQETALVGDDAPGAQGDQGETGDESS